jgi:hypothetical protein
MQQGYSCDSCTTATVKGEVLLAVQHQLQDASMAHDDTTLMAMLHLLAGEIWAGDERVWRVHMDGIAQFVVQRHGLIRIGRSNKALADVTARCVQQAELAV